MKKRMFLTTILMTLVLLVAVTTATFAWYQAQASSVAYTNPNDEQALNTAVNGYASGSFEVTVEFGAVSGAPVLTDAEGKTYYYAGSVEGSEILDSTAGPKSGSVAFTVKVEYKGTGLSDAEIADLWNQIGENIKVVITDTSEGAHIVAGAGLKFWTNDEHQTTWADGASSVTYTFNKGAVSFASQVGTIGTGSVWYGAKGLNDVAQTATDAYEMTATVSKNS